MLSRALVETVFVLNALCEEVTPDELASSDLANRRKISNAFLPIAAEAMSRSLLNAAK